MGFVKANAMSAVGSGVIAVLILSSPSTVESFVPCEHVRRTQSIRSRPTVCDVPPSVGALGQNKLSPFGYNHNNGNSLTRSPWATIPPPQGGAPGITSTTFPPPLLPPTCLSPPPIDLAKQFVALSQKHVQSILINGVNDGDCTGLSLHELYEATKTIKAVMKQKEQLFRDILTKQQMDHQRAQQQYMGWQAYYNQTLQQFQAKVHQQHQTIENKTRLYEGQIEEWRNRATLQERTSSEKIQWLTQQLQQLKVEAHEKQVQASQAAHAEQLRLRHQVDELQSQLQQQMQLTEAATTESRQQCARRADLEREMARIRAEFQSTTERLEKELSDEKAHRANEHSQARKHLEVERSKWQGETALARTEMEQHKTALTEGLKAKDLELQRVQGIQTQMQSQQQLLSRHVDSMRSELEKMRADHRKQLEMEQQAAARKQASLLTEIQRYKSELGRVEKSFRSESDRAVELEQHRRTLEQQVSELQQKHDKAVASWESRYQSMQRNFINERSELQTSMEREREEMRSKIDFAERRALERKDELDRVVQVKQAEFKQALEELRSISIKTEQDLTSSLQDLSNALQKHKLEANQILQSVREDALAKQTELLSALARKDEDISAQSTRIKQEAARSLVHWEYRMKVEKELAYLKKEHRDTSYEWQERYNALEEIRNMEQKAALMTLTTTEAEIRQRLKRVQAALNKLENQLQHAQTAKNKSEELLIDTLTKSAQRKESELLAELERTRNELQQFKLESHRKAMGEKEAAKKAQDNLVTQIAAKEKEIEEAKRKVKEQSDRANEFLLQRMDLENHLNQVNKDYDAALKTWQVAAASNEEARSKEKEAAVAMLAQKEAEMLIKVAAAMNEAAVHQLALESGLKARDRQFFFELQEVRQAAEKKERDLCQRVEILSQQLQEVKLESHQSHLNHKQEADQKISELRNLLTHKDLELDQERKYTAEHRNESQQLKQRQLELYREISDLRLQSARAVASAEARHQLLVEAREQDQKEAAKRLSQLEEEARAKVETAVSTAQQYETILTSSLENMTRLEEHLQSEITKLQRMVHDYCGCAKPDHADFLDK